MGEAGSDPPIPFSDVLLDIEVILQAFADHGVDFVLVGGVAAQLHGSPLTTEDVDLTPSADAANLQRCAAALTALGSQWRVPGLTEGFPPPVPLRGADIGHQTSASFVTRSGFIDVVIRHSDGAGYADLQPRATTEVVYGITLAIAGLDAIISAKEAAGRDKDERALPILHELRARKRQT